jgi:hypothetical protein
MGANEAGKCGAQGLMGVTPGEVVAGVGMDVIWIAVESVSVRHGESGGRRVRDVLGGEEVEATLS